VRGNVAGGGLRPEKSAHGDNKKIMGMNGSWMHRDAN